MSDYYLIAIGTASGRQYYIGNSGGRPYFDTMRHHAKRYDSARGAKYQAAILRKHDRHLVDVSSFHVEADDGPARWTWENRQNTVDGGRWIQQPAADPAPACPACAGTMDGKLDQAGECLACGWRVE